MTGMEAEPASSLVLSKLELRFVAPRHCEHHATGLADVDVAGTADI